MDDLENLRREVQKRATEVQQIARQVELGTATKWDLFKAKWRFFQMQIKLALKTNPPPSN